MKIKVAVLDKSVDFMNRLAAAFQKQYEDKISLLLFSDEEALYENIQRTRVDIVLTGQYVKADPERLAPGTARGLLCEVQGVDEIDGVPAICKYQKVENIYKSILKLYADNAANITMQKSNSDTRRVLFTSAQGGSGVSSAAAAYALRRAREGRKVFYLNLEKLGSADLYFDGTGSSSFSDVIYTLKSKNGNLELKLESIIQTDPSGVDFFHTCKNAYDMFELQDQEVEDLVSGIQRIGKYEEIILDLSGCITEESVGLMQNCADKIIYVTDGSAAGNGKFERFCEVLHVMEQRNEYSILDKTVLLYSRFSSKTSVQLDKTAVPVIGGIHRFEGVTDRELIQEIAQMEIIGTI